jgi:hypothetical protein
MDAINVVFLDVDGVLLPFEPSEEYSSSGEDAACWDCGSGEREAAWVCDVCSRCFCSACR